MTTPRTCRAVAPQPLTGNLGPFRCSLEVTRAGVHIGEHKAHRTVIGVGRITVKWKQDHHAGRQGVYRPEVALPTAGMTPLTGVVKDETRCACPDWKFGHGHVSPCPLVGR